jgi:hypothetical protein
MLVDVFFKRKLEDVSTTIYLGRLEIYESALEGLKEDEKDKMIEGILTVSLMANNIEWTPVSKDELGENITHDHILN